MAFVEIFYSICWISTISILWFYTDGFLYYSQLLGIFENTRYSYQAFLKDNPTSFFSDYLYAKSLETNNRFFKFLLKLLSCPFCLLVWFSLIAAFLQTNLLAVGPIYIGSLFIVLQIKRML